MSKLLLLMKNSTILGGASSLLGTSTSVVVDGLAQEGELLGTDGKQIKLS